MPVIRCTAVLAPVSGITRDRVTNSFHFRKVGVPLPADLDELSDAVHDFYVEPAGAHSALMTDIAKSVADTGHEIRVYTYDEGTGDRLNGNGSPPELVIPMSFAGRGGETVGLPNETALKLTFRNTFTVGVPLARRTGGVKIGPLEGSLLVEGPSGIAVPNATIQDKLLDVAEVLQLRAELNGTPLCVWSRPVDADPTAVPPIAGRAGTMYDVDLAFIDDEFDVVRRRGRPTGTRTSRPFA